MAFRMQQFRCKKCEKEFEELLNSQDPDQVVECPKEFCGSTDVERILSVGSGKGAHHSWGKWKV